MTREFIQHAVVTHPSRADIAAALVNFLEGGHFSGGLERGASFSPTSTGPEGGHFSEEGGRFFSVETVCDTTGLGAGANHFRAWVACQGDPVWIGVLEDDAVPIPLYHTQIREALEVAPTPVVSAYLGTSRPPQWQIPIQAALGRDTNWVVTDQLLHGVAVYIRSELVSDMLTHAPFAHDRHGALPYDEAIGQWARGAGIPVSYTNPSLVDHKDVDTIVAHRDSQPRTQPRVAHRLGTRALWDRTTTWMSRSE